jgi:hypothetical protein
MSHTQTAIDCLRMLDTMTVAGENLATALQQFVDDCEAVYPYDTYNLLDDSEWSDLAQTYREAKGVLGNWYAIDIGPNTNGAQE